LQDELSHLSGTTEHGQVGQEKKIVDPSSIEKNLQSLGTASLIYDWEFSKLKGQKEDCWPRHKLTATGQESFFYTVIPCQSHYYNLSFFSRLDQPVIYGLVTDLLALQKEEQKKLDDSVELVEATIEKIKHARQEVDRLQMRMNRSMAFLQDAVVLTDLSGRILFINLVASNWFSGLEENDSIVEIQNFFGGKSWLGLVHKLLSTYAPIYQELLLLSDHAGDAEKNKTLLCQAAKLDVDTSSSAVQTHFLLVFTDVSQLREAERSKRETLAFLSHDMRSPIVSQLATITSLREDNTLDKGFDQVLDKLEHYGLRSLKYSEDFLQLSRAESIKKLLCINR